MPSTSLHSSQILVRVQKGWICAASINAWRKNLHVWWPMKYGFRCDTRQERTRNNRAISKIVPALSIRTWTSIAFHFVYILSCISSERIINNFSFSLQDFRNRLPREQRNDWNGHSNESQLGLRGRNRNPAFGGTESLNIVIADFWLALASRQFQLATYVWQCVSRKRK